MDRTQEVAGSSPASSTRIQAGLPPLARPPRGRGCGRELSRSRVLQQSGRGNVFREAGCKDPSGSEACESRSARLQAPALGSSGGRAPHRSEGPPRSHRGRSLTTPRPSFGQCRPRATDQSSTRQVSMRYRGSRPVVVLENRLQSVGEDVWGRATPAAQEAPKQAESRARDRRDRTQDGVGSSPASSIAKACNPGFLPVS
jgi:hypothetical protein